MKIQCLRAPYNANAGYLIPYISTYEAVRVNSVVGEVIRPYGV